MDFADVKMVTDSKTGRLSWAIQMGQSDHMTQWEQRTFSVREILTVAEVRDKQEMDFTCHYWRQQYWKHFSFYEWRPAPTDSQQGKRTAVL